MELKLEPGTHSLPVAQPSPSSHPDRGAWMSSAYLRPDESEQVEHVVAFGSDELDAEYKLLTAIGHRLGRDQSMAPDSPQVRQLIQLYSLGSDLADAIEILELAQDADAKLQHSLAAHAVTIYGRTFRSNVRGELSEFVDFDEEDTAMRETLKLLRNRTIAHSESTMSVTQVILDLERDPTGAVAVERTRGLTAQTHMPSLLVTDFKAHVLRAKSMLESEVKNARAKLGDSLTSEELKDLFECPRRARFIPLPFGDWEPGKRRSKDQPHPEQPILMGQDAGTTGSVTIRIQ